MQTPGVSTRRRSAGAWFLVTLTALLGTAGCGSSPPSRFYLLTPVPGTEMPEDSAISIRLAPLEMPRYLATPEIVVRQSPNQLELADFDRWAEPLADNFERVLMENLARLVPTERVTRVPWEGTGSFTHYVTVVVQRFDVEAGQAILDVSWGVSSGPTEEGTLHRARYTRESDGSRFPDHVDALSLALADLSEAIATEIRRDQQ